MKGGPIGPPLLFLKRIQGLHPVQKTRRDRRKSPSATPVLASSLTSSHHSAISKLVFTHSP
jgi:hypothetical protein